MRKLVEKIKKTTKLDTSFNHFTIIKKATSYEVAFFVPIFFIIKKDYISTS